MIPTFFFFIRSLWSFLKRVEFFVPCIPEKLNHSLQGWDPEVCIFYKCLSGSSNAHPSLMWESQTQDPDLEALATIVYFCVCAKLLQLSRLFATLGTVACQPLLSMGFSRQEYWSGLPWPPPGDLPDTGIKPVSLLSPALAGAPPLAPPGKPLLCF